MTEETNQATAQEPTQEPTTQATEKPEPKPEPSKEPSTTNRDGGDVVSAKELEAAQNRIHELNKENQKRRMEIKEWEKFQEDGYDPEKIQGLIKQQKDLERKQLEEQGRYEELIEQMQTERETELNKIKEEKDTELGTMKKTLEKYFIDNAVTESLSKEGGSPKLLGKHIKEQLKVVEEGGEYKTVVLNSEGEPRTKRGGALFTVDDLVQEMKNDDEYARGFSAPNVTGSGTTSTQTPSSKTPPPSKPRSKMTMQEKINFRKEHGAEAYDKLPLN